MDKEGFAEFGMAVVIALAMVGLFTILAFVILGLQCMGVG